MGEVITGVHPVGIHCAEILDLELDEGFGEVGGVSELDSEVIWRRESANASQTIILDAELTSLKFKGPAQNVHQKLDNGIHRS